MQNLADVTQLTPELQTWRWLSYRNDPKSASTGAWASIHRSWGFEEMLEAQVAPMALSIMMVTRLLMMMMMRRRATTMMTGILLVLLLMMMRAMTNQDDGDGDGA